MNKYHGDEKRETSWHMSKEVTVSTLVALFIAYSSGLGGYFSLKADVEKATEDRIRKTTVNQMFETRDTKIISIVEDVKEIKTNQREFQKEYRETQQINQELMREIIRKLPRDN